MAIAVSLFMPHHNNRKQIRLDLARKVAVPFSKKSQQQQMPNPFNFGVQNNTQSRGVNDFGSKPNQLKTVRTPRDIFSASATVNKPFGGKTVVFGGDYKQILPVIPGGTKQQIVHASLNSSYLWDNCKVLKLTKNMRLQNLLGDEETNTHRKFSEWILSIGNGVIGGPNDGEVSIEIPEDMLIRNFTNPVKAIVSSTYPNFLSECHSPT